MRATPGCGRSVGSARRKRRRRGCAGGFAAGCRARFACPRRYLPGCRAGDPETLVALRDLLVRDLRAALTGRAPAPDATLAGRGAAEALPLVADYLARCSACRAEFEALLDALHAIEGDAAVPALA